MLKSSIVWEERSLLKIRLDPNRVSIHPLGHEAEFFVDYGEKRYHAIVPTHSLGEGRRFVPAERVGHLGNLALVVLPVGNDGTTTWRIPEDELEGMLYN